MGGGCEAMSWGVGGTLGREAEAGPEGGVQGEGLQGALAGWHCCPGADCALKAGTPGVALRLAAGGQSPLTTRRLDPPAST